MPRARQDKSPSSADKHRSGAPSGQKRCESTTCACFLAAWDDHPFCTRCRTCSKDKPCRVCKRWDNATWDLYNKRRTYRSRRHSQDRGESTSSTTPKPAKPRHVSHDSRPASRPVETLSHTPRASSSHATSKVTLDQISTMQRQLSSLLELVSPQTLPSDSSRAPAPRGLSRSPDRDRHVDRDRDRTAEDRDRKRDARDRDRKRDDRDRDRKRDDRDRDRGSADRDRDRSRSDDRDRRTSDDRDYGRSPDQRTSHGRSYPDSRSPSPRSALLASGRALQAQDRSKNTSRSPSPRNYTNRRPTSRYSPNYYSRHRGYHEPLHDVDRQFYDRDIKQRDLARYHAARDRERDQEADSRRPVSRSPSRSPTPRRRRADSRRPSRSPKRKRRHSRSPSRQRSPRRSSSRQPVTSAHDSPGSSPSRSPSPERKQLCSPTETKTQRRYSRSRSSSRSSSPCSTRGYSQSPSRTPHYDTHSSSPEDEDPPATMSSQPSETATTLPSYADRIEAVRSEWAHHSGMSLPVEEKEAEDVALGAHGSTSKPKLYLPWHPPHDILLKKHQAVLDGNPASETGKSHKPLDQNGFLRKPGFRDEQYNIVNHPDTEAVQLPENFQTIQASGDLKARPRNKAKPAVVIPNHLARDVETQIRRALRIQSYQEWFFGSAREMMEKNLQKPDSVPPTAVLAQMVSGARAMVDANQVTTQLLHNFLLMRRDSYLDTLDRTVPKEHVQILRRHSLADSRMLFDRESVEAAQRATAEARQTALITAAATATARGQRRGNSGTNYGRQQSSPNRSQHSSPRSNGGSPRGNNNNNNRGQWKGKRSPKGKGSPSFHKKGGNKGDK